MLQGHKNSGNLLCPILRGEKVSGWEIDQRNMSLTRYGWHLVISVAPSPQGELFATGSGDMRARIWRLAVKPLLACDLFANADMIDRYWPYNPIN